MRSSTGVNQYTKTKGGHAGEATERTERSGESFNLTQKGSEVVKHEESKGEVMSARK